MIGPAVEQEVAALYRAQRAPELVDVPTLGFLTIDGVGDPNSSERFPQVVQALFAVSYAIKFALKRSGGPVYRVSPLECLWTAGDFTGGGKSTWTWTAMVRQPEAVSVEHVECAARDVAQKKRSPLATELTLTSYAEGLSAQVLHVGPYADEGPTIERLHEFIREQGMTLRGRHHEIYLGDPRRASSERLRTIVRQPVTQ